MCHPVNVTHNMNERGAIIIIVLLVLAVLSFLSIELSKETLIDRVGVAYIKSSFSGAALCDSGMVLAKQVLLDDAVESESDNLHEEWANFATYVKPTSQELSSGTITGSIIDENSRFPINKIRQVSKSDVVSARQYQAIFYRMLVRLCEDLNIEADPSSYIESIRYWMGEQIESAQDDDAWYLERDVQYLRPYSSLRTPQELLLIRWDGSKEGDVERLYYGTDKVAGLRDLITVWGGGPINMNTVRTEVARAIPIQENQQNDFAAAVLAYQTEPENYFADKWYVGLLQYLGVNVSNMPTRCMTTTSNIFAIQLEVAAGSGQRRECTIVRRTSNKLYPIFSYAN